MNTCPDECSDRLLYYMTERVGEIGWYRGNSVPSLQGWDSLFVGIVVRDQHVYLRTACYWGLLLPDPRMRIIVLIRRVICLSL